MNFNMILDASVCSVGMNSCNINNWLIMCNIFVFLAVYSNTLQCLYDYHSIFLFCYICSLSMKRTLYSIMVTSLCRLTGEPILFFTRQLCAAHGATPLDYCQHLYGYAEVNIIADILWIYCGVQNWKQRSLVHHR